MKKILFMVIAIIIFSSCGTESNFTGDAWLLRQESPVKNMYYGGVINDLLMPISIFSPEASPLAISLLYPFLSLPFLVDVPFSLIGDTISLPYITGQRQKNAILEEIKQNSPEMKKQRKEALQDYNKLKRQISEEEVLQKEREETLQQLYKLKKQEVSEEEKRNLEKTIQQNLGEIEKQEKYLQEQIDNKLESKKILEEGKKSLEESIQKFPSEKKYSYRIQILEKEIQALEMQIEQLKQLQRK